MSFLTCFWLFPQNEHFSRSPPSPIRATGTSFRSGPVRRVRRAGGHTSACVLDGTPRWAHTSRSEPACIAPMLRSRSLERLQNLIDEAVLDRALRGEDLVALDVATDLLDRLSGVLGDHPLQHLPHPQDLV